jgi:hypothetical protein
MFFDTPPVSKIILSCCDRHLNQGAALGIFSKKGAKLAS